jgi:beta-lactam-binding protein with PASTA domain
MTSPLLRSRTALAVTIILLASLVSACVVRSSAPPRPAQYAFVPAIEGMDVERARNVLGRAGFRLGGITKETTRRAPSGTVLHQDPKPGTRYRQGSGVSVLLARQMGSVPRLRGMRLERAERVLERAGFQLGQVTERVSDRAREGAVIRQSPKPAQAAELGSRVNLVVAGAQARMPNLEGLHYKAARKSLRQAGLELGEVTEKLTDRRRDGTVLRQRPRVGLRVAPGEQVDLVIAVAPRQVPRLKGLSLKRAGKTLKRAGLPLGQVTERMTDKAPAGTVLRQHPRAAEQVAPGTEVDLVVARRAPANPDYSDDYHQVPRLTGLPLKRAGKTLKRAGLPLGRVTDRPSNKVPAGTVMRQHPKAGEQVPPGTRVDLVVARLAGLSKPAKPDYRTKPTEPEERTERDDRREQDERAERAERADPAKAAMARVPKLHGLSVKAARRALKGMGLRAGRIKKEHAKKGKPSTVVAQTPAAGTRVEAGTSVDLVIKLPRQGVNPSRVDESPLNAKPPRD